ncbi:MAG: amidohydrolase [Deltaproteobacteria bacterium]|nr:amidohydrolase [Deltaproteobacteria bacterium]
MPKVIDIHAHFLPQPFIEAVTEVSPDYGGKVTSDREGRVVIHLQGMDMGPVGKENFDLKLRLADMDRAGIDMQILSLTVPMVYWAEPGLAVTLARLVNDEYAKAAKNYPGRFGGFATLPLQDIDKGIEEMERAILDLGLQGVCIGSNINGKDFDDPELRPFFRRAQALKVPIFVHPANVVGAERWGKHRLWNLLGNPFDTAIAMAKLILGGVLEELPDLTVCFAHGGGAFPYLKGRIDHGYTARRESTGEIPRLPSAYLRGNIYYDTILHDDAALAYLIAAVGSEKVLLGSDYPYAMGDLDPVPAVKRLKSLLPSESEKILGGNAARLLNLDS